AGALAAYQAALAALRRAMEYEPRDAAHPRAARAVYQETARLKEAARDVQGAEADWRAGANAGQRAASLGRTSAVYAYEGSRGFVERGRFYERSGANDKALPAYEEAIRKADIATKLDEGSELYHRNASDARRLTGALLQQSGNSGRARDNLAAAVRAGRRAT